MTEPELLKNHALHTITKELTISNQMEWWPFAGCLLHASTAVGIEQSWPEKNGASCFMNVILLTLPTISFWGARRLKLRGSKKLLRDYRANKWCVWDFNIGFTDTKPMTWCLSSKDSTTIWIPLTSCLSVCFDILSVWSLFLSVTLIGPWGLSSPDIGAFITSVEIYASAIARF